VQRQSPVEDSDHAHSLFMCDYVMKLLFFVSSCKTVFPVVLGLQKLFSSFPTFWDVVWEGRVQLLLHPGVQSILPCTVLN